MTATKLDLTALDRDFTLFGDNTEARTITIGQQITFSDVVIVDVATTTFNGKLVFPSVNEAATPTLAFGDGDSGLYEQSDDILAIATGGVAAILVGATQITTFNRKIGILTDTTPTADGMTVQHGGLTAVFGADNVASTLTNSSQKNTRIGAPHYLNAEQPTAMFYVNNIASANQISYGGGTGLLNAATEISFFTAPNTTTTSGTKRMLINGSGRVGINDISPDAMIDIVAYPSIVGFQIELDATPADAMIIIDSAAADLFRINATGEVSIGGSLAIKNIAEGNTAKLSRTTSHETHTLSLATTSDTTTISIPSGARLLAVSLNVNTAVTNGGDNTWSAAFITGSTTTLATAAAAAQNTKVDLMLPDEISTDVCEIQFTPQAGSFTAGIIEIVAYYEFLTSLANV